MFLNKIVHSFTRTCRYTPANCMGLLGPILITTSCHSTIDWSARIMHSFTRTCRCSLLHLICDMPVYYKNASLLHLKRPMQSTAGILQSTTPNEMSPNRQWWVFVFELVLQLVVHLELATESYVDDTDLKGPLWPLKARIVWDMCWLFHL